MLRGADTKANALWDCSALELFQHAVLLDAACDDEGRGDAEALIGEVDRLGWLGALELVNLQHMSIDAATQGVLMGADGKANTLAC